jgi:hypothetical protein
MSEHVEAEYERRLTEAQKEVTAAMVGESLQRPTDIGILRRPVLELAQQQDVGVLRFTPDGPAKTPVAPTAVDDDVKCVHPPTGRQPPAYTEPWRSVRACRGRRPLDPCRRPPPDHFAPDTALQTASRALRVLAMIADDDVHFGEAIAKIESWLKERKMR